MREGGKEGRKREGGKEGREREEERGRKREGKEGEGGSENNCSFNSSLPFLFRFITVVIKCLIDASSGEPNHLLQSHAPSIIKNIIIPSCVWRAGRSEILSTTIYFIVFIEQLVL